MRAEAAQLMREGIAAAEAEPPADPALSSSTPTSTRRPRSQRDLAELRRILGG